LEGDDLETLEAVQTALQNPKWQLFLGRKAFVPDLPVYFREGVLTIENSDESLKDFLQSDELNQILQKFDEEFGRQLKGNQPRRRLIIEDNEKGTETRQDVPLSFAERRFTNRRVRTEFISNKGEKSNGTLSDEDDFESALAPGSV